MRKNLTLFLLIFTASTFSAQAQIGQSDVRFVDNTPFNDDGYVSIIIEVKAASSDTEFFMSEQNYRFSFNRNAIANPRIAQELAISNFISPVPVTRNLGFALFSPHNLTGSLDTTVSYNVELAGGDGYYLTADEWVQVGIIEFDILEADACYNLVWYPQAVFPPTFVGEVFTENGVDARENTDENSYGNVSDCLSSFPVELIYFTGEERHCKNHLAWETATEINSDYFVIERSPNAVQFSEIGRIEAAGNSLQNTAYNFVDSWVGTKMYYRLKQVDINGSYEYFDIIKVDSGCNVGAYIDVFPNPVSTGNQAFTTLFTDTDKTVYIEIMDVGGALVSTTSAEIFTGSNVIGFPTDNLSAGAYFIRVRGDNWFSTVNKFIKLNE